VREERRTQMGAPVTWFEISSSDSEALRDFYADAFDWTFQVPEGFPYGLVDTGVEGAIGGGIGEAQGPNQVIFYIEVEELQAYLDRIAQLGGKTVVPVTAIPGLVTFAQFADPKGNVVGLVKGP
jgi:predicted enzyme related to lactoylglutathione lyase